MQEHILKGTEITLNKKAAISSPIGSASCAVRRGHEVCGDSAFLYCDDDNLIFGVFDGVSGEPGADRASSAAAAEILRILKGLKSPGEKGMREALTAAHASLTDGYTTALVVFVGKDGRFVAASVGDSSLYSIDIKGNISLEMPLGRIVKEGDTIFRFMKFRNIVKSVIGWNAGGMEIQMQRGKLSAGEILILSSDCLPDNLEIEVSEFNVEDASGTRDLKGIIGRSRSPEKILDKIYKEIRGRMSLGGRKLRGQFILEPKLDDLAILVFKYLG
ncbi:MAG: protein phosphatase 2C domain-containing protein [Candidatus Micrarchaeota archaeon]